MSASCNNNGNGRESEPSNLSLLRAMLREMSRDESHRPDEAEVEECNHLIKSYFLEKRSLTADR